MQTACPENRKKKCPNSSCVDCYPCTLQVDSDKDEGADNRQPVNKTAVIQDKISYQSPVTLSSPAPGLEDRKAFAVTPGADGTYRSTIDPILPEIEPDENWDNRPNWLPVWSQDELSQMQKDDDNIRFILENKLEGQKPVLQEIPQLNPVMQSLWYQWENLEVKNDVLYRRWKDNKGDVVFQLVAPEEMRKLIFHNLHTAETAGHFGRDCTGENIKQTFYWP